MKKLTTIFIVTIVAIVLSACSNDQAGASEITITLEINDLTSETVISDEELQVVENTTVLSILEEHHDVEVQDGGLLTAIDGYERDTTKNIHWLYEVNGEMVSVGANEYQVKDNDHITFDLQKLD
ncbi:DUF4430 domain-containing protein [Gracilibacillus sp. S3-1-1]|uniref:DUF4430 domain-containing protein n=1 Tax=Gracilibacillus pellucidus TaxID=3095368 RepID=A0ACC6M543_9BACI|nr:DUF4430 domain-containing protein [Gracilibacillus sp. S3-1-1]MDX8046090.1 DUF4430 domain-containing protein [Gracilibacillus sp. S3-1-1]